MAWRGPAQGNLDVFGDLIYWNGEVPKAADQAEEGEEPPEMGGATTSDAMHHALTTQRESMYVTLFERMSKIVLKHEAHLLSPAEFLCLDAYDKLTYHAKFLLVRLTLRKYGKVHRLSKLPFHSELGPFVPAAIAELCRKKFAGKLEVIDLTSDDGGSSSGTDTGSEPDLTIFADDESSMTLIELLECLTLPECTTLAKELKIRVPNTRRSIITAIEQYALTQTALAVPAVTANYKGKQTRDAKPSRQTQLSFPTVTLKSAVNPVRALVLKILNKCIRINPDVLRFFRRLNIIFFRDTRVPDKILTPSLLCRIKRRFYPSYEFTRTPDVWKTRGDFIEFEKALELEDALDQCLDPSGGISGIKKSKAHRPTPGPTLNDIGKSTALIRAGTPEPAQGARPDSVEPCTGIVKPALRNDVNNADLNAEAEVEPQRLRDAKTVKAMFEFIYPFWKEQVSKAVDEVEEEMRRRRGLRRFECGYVYTRIVEKGAEALGVLKEYNRELEMLEALLLQRRWRRGSRGAWHERRALILMRHLRSGGESNLRRALDVVIEGLQDEDTHMVHRLKLEKRLTALEKKLKISKEERHTCAGVLVRAQKVFIEGIRVRATSVAPDLATTASADPRPVHERDLLFYGVTLVPRNPCKDESNQPLKTTELSPSSVSGKSVWVGREGDHVSVETLALQEYERHGYKGFHCEGRIITTLFGLLFWDILFADIPGALETPWQSAPMDLTEDSFYFARQDLIEKRLSEIENGQGPAILVKFDEMHREQGTMCVGVRWDLFQRQDLVEIAQCIGGKPLSVICRLLSEDYANRTSGVADLVVWSVEKGECRFVEVKGPGDSERDNQRLWIDVLLRAGVIAEVCRVEEHGQPKRKKRESDKSPRKRRAAPRIEGE